MKIISRGLSLILLSIFTFSCQNSVEQKYTAKQFEQVGTMHNEGLDFVMANLKNQTFASPINGKRTLTELLNENQKATMAFLKKEAPDLTDDQVKFVDEKLTKMTNYFTDYASKKNSTSSGREATLVSDDLVSGLLTTSVTPYLTAAQSVKVNQILSALNAYGNDMNALQQSLNSIQNQVYSLPTEQQPIIFAAISIAMSSAQYWQTNYDTWSQEVSQMLLYDSNGQIVVAKAVPSNGVVAGMDVVGGLITGIGCYLSGPVGWAFSLKLVSGVALGVSAGTALMMQ